MAAKKKTKKDLNVPVTRKFLLGLANDIHNPKTKKFLRLCDGTLQNGPDPTDKERPMHCGLGELYFAMTGLQPKDTGIREDGVIELACERSSLTTKLKNEVLDAKKAIDQLKADAKKTLSKLKISSDLKRGLLNTLDYRLSDLDSDASNHFKYHLTDNLGDSFEEFRGILNQIPEDNDDGEGDACSLENFKARSERVANLLRDAAKLLPA